MDKCKQCNLNFDGECDYYGEIPVEDAIMICEVDNFLQYPPDGEPNDKE